MSEYIISTEQINFFLDHTSEDLAIPASVAHLEPIIRCRDCRYAHAEPPSDRRSRKKYQGGYWCDKLTEGIGLFCESDDYCSWGERRES